MPSPISARRARSWTATTRPAPTVSAPSGSAVPPATCTRRCSRRLGGAPHAPPARRGVQGARRRRRGGTAGRDHAVHGVDAAQPVAALRGRRRHPGSASDGRGGAGADATARRERPVVVGGHGGRSASVLAGRSQRAVDVLVRTAGRDPLEAIPGAWRAIGFEALATAYLDLDRGDEAARVADAAEAHAAALGLPMAAAWAQRAAAAVALHAGQPAAAAERAIASVAAA